MSSTFSTPASPNDLAIGGKARALRDLQRAGFRVPEFECSPPDLDAAIVRLGFPLAVRSSASLEDGRQVSFAGQFESALNLTTREVVAEAVRRCQASLRSASVRDYCRKHRLDPSMLTRSAPKAEETAPAPARKPAKRAQRVETEAAEAPAPRKVARGKR